MTIALGTVTYPCVLPVLPLLRKGGLHRLQVDAQDFLGQFAERLRVSLDVDGAMAMDERLTRLQVQRGETNSIS